MTKRDNAIIITGTRMEYLLLDQIYTSFKQYVLDLSNPDIFIYGYYDGIGDEIRKEICNKYSKYLVTLELFPMKDLENHRDYLRFIPKGMQAKDYNILELHRRAYEGQLEHYQKHIKKENYKVIMRTRPDMLYMTPIDMSKYETFNELALYSPRPQNGWGTIPTIRPREQDGLMTWWEHCGVNDQCILGSNFSMKIYSNLVYLIMTLKNFEHIFIENTIYKILVEVLKFNIKKADFRYDLFRKD